MKILFFILGSVNSRIVKWGIENMKEVLEQDVVFFGPIEETEFVLEGKAYPLIHFNNVITVDQLFGKLPEKWFPDVVVCDVSTINYIPDIYNCPAKTYLLGRDGWGDLMYNRGMCEFFDFLSYGIIDRNEYKHFSTKLMPLLGMPVSIPSQHNTTPKFSDRKTNVISISNYNSGFYHDRYKTFYELAQRSNGLNVQYWIGLKRSQIHEYYRTAKIVLDWAHTLSNRSYEAALNGCLLFSHKDNTLMKEFWIPYEEYIPYDKNNLHELVNYYLNNPQESQEIINNMMHKMERIPSTFGGSIHYHLREVLASEVNIKQRAERARQMDKSQFYHRISTGFYFYYFYNQKELQPNWETEYFARIDKAISNAASENQIRPLIEAARLGYLINHAETKKYFYKLESALPGYAWTYYFLAKAHLREKNIETASDYAQKAKMAVRENPSLIDQYPLPFSERGDQCDNHRIIHYLWKSASNQWSKTSEAVALQHQVCKLQGDIELVKKNIDGAIGFYNESVTILPLTDLVISLSDVLLTAKKYEEIINITNEGIKYAPYNSVLKQYLFVACLKTGEKKEGKKMIKEHYKVLRAFKNNKRIMADIWLGKALMLLASFGICAKSIIGLSKIIQKQ